MKRPAFVVGTMIVVLIMLTSCDPDTQLLLSPTIIKPTATHTPTSTHTPEPPTPTPTPSQTPIPPFRDDFDQFMMDGWTWLREADLGWDLLQRPGFLRIQVRVETWQLLVRDAPESNFEISTRVLFTPYSNFQSAGLVVYQDEGHYLSFHRGMCEYLFAIPDLCQGNAIYFNQIDHDIGSPERYYSVGPQFPTRTDVRSEAYLRLTREGRTYTGYYSDDGENWMTIGSHEPQFVPDYVGILTCCAVDSWTYADFDYFVLEALPSE